MQAAETASGQATSPTRSIRNWTHCDGKTDDNAGVVSEPGHRGRHYYVATRAPDGPYVDSDTWLAHATRHDGSWWPEWAGWLETHSSGRAAPPAMGAPEQGLTAIDPAPGRYVGQR